MISMTMRRTVRSRTSIAPIHLWLPVVHQRAIVARVQLVEALTIAVVVVAADVVRVGLVVRAVLVAAAARP